MNRKKRRRVKCVGVRLCFLTHLENKFVLANKLAAVIRRKVPAKKEHILLLYLSAQPSFSLCSPQGRRKLSSPSFHHLFLHLFLLFSSLPLLHPRRSRSCRHCCHWWSQPGSRVFDVLVSDCILAWWSRAGRDKQRYIYVLSHLYR